MYRGMVYTVGSSVLWGFLPLYLKALSPIPTLEILAHRVIWAFMSAAIVLIYRHEWRWVVATLRCPKTLAVLGASSALIGINWLLYIWAVSTNSIVESSLGYFIAPLVSMLFGAIFLKEKLEARQKIAIIIAAGGVIYISLSVGAIPWIGLILAIAFAGYAILKKVTSLDVISGLALEMMVLTIPAVIYLGYLGGSGRGSVSDSDLITGLELGGVGVLTAILLLLYTAGVRQLPLATSGILQYLTPSFQFFIGVFLFHESLTGHRLFGFSLIWLALLVYLSNAIWQKE